MTTVLAPTPATRALRVPRRNGRQSALLLGALGVVYGDIGTSPLYTIQTILHGSHEYALDRTTVFGALSLVFWSLLIVVTIKYLLIVMRAGNHGEGGIMALISLIYGVYLRSARWKAALIAVGVLGAALFYGDALITPAISVLSAVEGLEIASPKFAEWVLPLTLFILVGLFVGQRFGTQVVGSLFGPVMIVWFTVLGGLGIAHISQHPDVLKAMSPSYGVHFLVTHGFTGFFTLGAVVLAVTGAEALYADMGHFGVTAIRRAWFLLVLPALVLNYFGQGALILDDPASINSPFFHQVPAPWEVPLVVLAALATIIASQAVISGAYSMTRQAIRLGFLPLLDIRHTSEETEGQIYIPAVNWTLFGAIVMMVLGFRHSANLANAYGLAVTGTFTVTTILAAVLAYHSWSVPKLAVLLTGGALLLVDVAFFLANFAKFLRGGWFPVTVALVVFAVLMTWQRGQTVLRNRRVELEGSLQEFVDGIRSGLHSVTRVPGTAVFLSANHTSTPLALRYNVAHNHVIHEHVVVLTVETEARPRVPDSERVTVDPIRVDEEGIVLVRARFGYSERPDVPAALRAARDQGLPIDVDNASYFVTRSSLRPNETRTMSRAAKTLFIAMNRNSASPIRYFNVPEARVVSLGSTIAL